MKNKIVISFLLVLFTVTLLAQQRSDEEAVRAVADNILKQPVTQFVGVSNGVVYNSTAEIPEGDRKSVV